MPIKPHKDGKQASSPDPSAHNVSCSVLSCCTVQSTKSFHHRGHAVVPLIISSCCLKGMYIMYLLIYNSMIRQTSRVRQFYHCFKGSFCLFCIFFYDKLYTGNYGLKPNNHLSQASWDKTQMLMITGTFEWSQSSGNVNYLFTASRNSAGMAGSVLDMCALCLWESHSS